MIRVDYWYNNNPADVDRISISFSDVDFVYRGNIYSSGKCIGDYTATNSIELEKHFSQLRFNWTL